MSDQLGSLSFSIIKSVISTLASYTVIKFVGSNQNKDSNTPLINAIGDISLSIDISNNKLNRLFKF